MPVVPSSQSMLGTCCRCIFQLLFCRNECASLSALGGLIESRLRLLCNLCVELDVRPVVGVVLHILDCLRPDTAELRSRVLSNSAPGGPSTKELVFGSLGGECVGNDTSGAGNTAKVANAAKGVAAEDVLGDERAAVEDHDFLCPASTAVGNNDRLCENILAKEVAPAVVNGDLDGLNDNHNSGDVAKPVPEVALAEEVVQVVVETVVDLVDDEDLLHLLDDGLLTSVVDDLEVLLLDLDYLLLLVEVVEAVDEVEGAVVAVEAVDDGVEADLALGRGVDGLCGCEGGLVCCVI